jgi:hypothetical protein
MALHVDEAGDNALDFLIIGAQKSGTTSLFEHLREHPAITMPEYKEIPYFTPESGYRQDWAELVREHFPRGRSGVILGKSTPHYMASDRAVSRRIQEMNPRMKIIAILRDPVERAFSHYKMVLRGGDESRPFDEAVAGQLDPDHLRSLRWLEFDYGHRHETYVAWGEYGRVLADYHKRFGADQVRVYFLDELQRDPHALLRDVFEFLGVDPTFVPRSAGTVFHKGRVSLLDRLVGWARRLRWARAVYHRVAPLKIKTLIRQKTRYTADQKNVRAEPMSPETRRRLEDHFRADVLALESLIGRPCPWDWVREN